ncbi:shikimate dehydrogenase [Microbacterium pseudoresistens]|uniref:Shikimate dehydrogenase n=1 Tax=Microbacterium pseudoresistens TaxID=640634 RepID=A0A7Y9EWY6_9MICO|nr:shikimate dehydrogenase [Microbacterium pseudoresistens]NYD55485.1 shikimate dehydrogenase [Microbacterium pseudoresistens]
MLNDADPKRLAVWGDPIAHSRSPQLHAAAYAHLGLDWEYGRRQMDAAGFRAAVDGLDESWRGLSLTMPLKDAALSWSRVQDRHARLTGAANTLVLSGPLRGHAWNTDVGGLVRVLHEHGLGQLDRVRILGAGATAASALVALAECGASRVDVVARRPARVAPLDRIAAQIGIALSAHGFDDLPAGADLTLSTLPGGVPLDDDVVTALSQAGGALLDVAYSPWPSTLAVAWSAEPVISGLEMLLHQAVLQVRIFVAGDVTAVLPGEDVMVARMRAALMGD